MSHQKDFPLAGRRSILKGACALFAGTIAANLLPRGLMAADGQRKTLILYYSWSGNTRNVARLIHKRIGGDIAEVEPVTAYPENYDICVAQAKKELADNFYPPIKKLTVNPADYSLIILGSPNWWATWSGPMRAFLLTNPLPGKTVLPFNTHGGGEWQNMLVDLKKACPQATILKGLAIRDSALGSASKKIDDWLKASGLVA